MQPYSYRDSGIEWQGLVPEHWQKDKLFRLCEKMGSGGTPSTSNESFYNGDIPWIQSGDLNDSFIYETEKSITAIALQSSSAKIFKRGTLLVAMYGATIGKLGIMTMDAATNQACCALQLSTKLISSFTYYLLLDMRAFLLTQSYGGGQSNISQEILKQRYFCYPPIEEQRAIAGFLDEACGKIDAAIQVKREQVAMLDVMAKAILNKAVLEGLNPAIPKQTINNIWFKTLPAHWQLRRLKDVSTMQTGVTLGKDYDGETDERPYLRVANVQDGHLALDDVKTIKLPPHLIRRYELQDGDVLMNEGGDLDKLGRGHVWHNEIPGCLHQNHVFALRCFPHKLLPDYLTLLTSSTHGRAYFEIMGKKTTNLASINSTKVNLFPVPLPPVTEQAEIVQWVQYERGKLKQAQDAVNAQISVLEAYKKSLVHECVTGKKQVWRGG